MKNKGAALILVILICILSIVSIVLYGSVMYKYQPVYYMLAGAIALCVLAFLLSGKLPKLAAYFPICIAALLASAAVWGAQLMVNQIGYVVAGLDGMDTIQPWIAFTAVTVAALVISIVASFLPSAKKAA